MPEHEPTAEERKRLFEAIADQYSRATQQRRDAGPVRVIKPPNTRRSSRGAKRD